jgi:DNA polymerase
VSETVACRPWLDAELALIRPDIIVCLGATAAQSVLGKGHGLLANRGRLFEHSAAPTVTATVHPSSILRAPDQATRDRDYEAFVDDLRNVRRMIKGSSASL